MEASAWGNSGAIRCSARGRILARRSSWPYLASQESGVKKPWAMSVRACVKGESRACTPSTPGAWRFAGDRSRRSCRWGSRPLQPVPCKLHLGAIAINGSRLHRGQRTDWARIRRWKAASCLPSALHWAADAACMQGQGQPPSTHRPFSLPIHVSQLILQHFPRRR